MAESGAGQRRAVGLAAVRARLAAASDALARVEQRVAAAPGAVVDAEETLTRDVAGQAGAGLAAVDRWLSQVLPPDMVPSPTQRTRRPGQGGAAAGGRTWAAAELAARLRAASDGLRALGEALEDEDPLAHFDAVQAVGLALAVLEGAHGRLLRAGLVEPRPVDLLER